MRKALILFCFFFSTHSFAQDIDYARRIIDTLTSPSMEGRGYVNDGDHKAAKFIRREFQKDGLFSFGINYSQKFDIAINTLPGNVNISIDKHSLKPGEDYLVASNTPALQGEFSVVMLDGRTLKSMARYKRFCRTDFSQKIIVVDKNGITDKRQLALADSLRKYNFLKAKALIFITDSKLTWSISAANRQISFAVVDIKRAAWPGKSASVTFDIDAQFLKAYTTQNVIGYIRGNVKPDSFLVFTAHYDHLGRMGNMTYFPGANDNASGTAMLLDLARDYSKPENQPRYSMVFIACSGEEAGLLGSKYLADHPVFPLSSVRFLMNLDMVGTGSEGVTMVNSTIFPRAYDLMTKINADNEYILTVKKRGESCNSDHCPFYEKKVPAVFIYSLGKEYTEYHNIYDKADHLPLSEYKDIFRLVRDFMNEW
jgi:aminopeptidase YwaD